jgi:hypothetical protein
VADPDMKKKGLRQEDYAYLLAMERRKRFGVYFIFKNMEPGMRRIMRVSSSTFMSIFPYFNDSPFLSPWAKAKYPALRSRVTKSV